MAHRRSSSIIIAFAILLFIASDVKSDGEMTIGNDWIFMPPGMYLGISPTDQDSYVSGVLDTLNHIRVNGLPADNVIDCLFNKTDSTKTMIFTSIYTKIYIEDKIRSGSIDFPIVEELFSQLDKECYLSNVQ